MENEYSSGGFFDVEGNLLFSTIGKSRREKEFVRDMHEHIQNMGNKNCVQERVRSYGDYGKQTDIELIIN